MASSVEPLSDEAIELVGEDIDCAVGEEEEIEEVCSESECNIEGGRTSTALYWSSLESPRISEVLGPLVSITIEC